MYVVFGLRIKSVVTLYSSYLNVQLVCFFGDGVSLCISGWAGTCWVDRAGLKLSEICLDLPLSARTQDMNHSAPLCVVRLHLFSFYDIRISAHLYYPL